MKRNLQWKNDDFLIFYFLLSLLSASLSTRKKSGVSLVVSFVNALNEHLHNVFPEKLIPDWLDSLSEFSVEKTYLLIIVSFAGKLSLMRRLLLQAL